MELSVNNNIYRITHGLSKRNVEEILEWLIIDYNRDSEEPLLPEFTKVFLNRDITWGLFDNDKCIGFMVINKESDHIMIELFSVAPDYRRNGLGSKFFIEVMMQIILDNLDINYLKLEPREKAIPFWSRLGFKLINSDKDKKMTLSTYDFMKDKQKMLTL